jgi:hypothetical protein
MSQAIVSTEATKTAVSASECDIIRESDVEGLENLLLHGLLSLPNHSDNELFLNTHSHLGMLPVSREEDVEKATVAAEATSPKFVSSWGRQHPNVQFGHGNAVKTLDLGGKRLYKGFPCSPHDSIGTFVSLTSLNLAGTDLPLQDILSILALHNIVNNVECLYLGGNGLQDEGANAIATQFLSSAKRLSKLDLRYNDIQASGMQAVCSALASGKVRHLYLEGNQIGNEGAAALAKLLVQQASNNSNTPLQEIFLGANKIQADGAKVMAEALYRNKFLSKLYLEGNQIGWQGANAFSTVLEALQGDTGLQHLFVDNNDIGKEGSKRLAKALNTGTAIEESLLE